MALPRWTEYNKIQQKRAFEVKNLVSAFNYVSKPYFEPYFESFDFDQIFLVLRGEGKYIARGNEYEISKGKMFFRPAGEESMYLWTSEEVSFALVSFVCDSSAKESFCNGPIELYDEERAEFLDITKTCERIFESIKENEEIQGMRIREDVPDAVFGFVVSSLERFLSMVWCRLNKVALVVDESGKVGNFVMESNLVYEVKRFLDRRTCEKVCLKDVCSYFGIGKTALMNKFKRECGVGVMEYFAALKVEAAKKFISTTSMNFFEISEKLGYSTPSYFSKIFKDSTGMSPTEYSRRVSKRRILNH